MPVYEVAKQNISAGANKQTRDLEGRGLVGERAEAVVGGVARELDEDIDAVLPHAPRKRLLVQGGDVAPGAAGGRDRRPQALRFGVPARRTAVHHQPHPAGGTKITYLLSCHLEPP